MTAQRTVELFAGPGGWDEGALALGAHLDIEGLELNTSACATARAAGHRRRQVDLTAVHPLEYESVTGLIASPVCVPFSPGGVRSGLGPDFQRVLDVWTSIGWGIPARDAMTDVAALSDPRTALLATAGVWALGLPNLEWLAMEQAATVEHAWVDLAAELFAAEWEWVDVMVLDAADFDLPSRRRRSFLVARRFAPGGHPGIRRRSAHAPTMAQALGWDAGHEVVTRGNRRPTGGNRFSADGPSWCLTGRSRSWERDDGLRLTPAQAGVLCGFRPDYPWTGSRTAQFQQAGDVVAPPVAAHVLAAALGRSRVHDTQEMTTTLAV